MVIQGTNLGGCAVSQNSVDLDFSR